MVSELPPFTVLQLEAMVIGTLALLFAVVWWRGREPGMAWIVAGFLLAACWYANSMNLPPSGPTIDSTVERVWSTVIAAAVLSLAGGLVLCLGAPKGVARWAVWACGLPGLLLIVALAVGATVTHAAFHVGVLVAYLGAALLAFRRAFTEPGDGHSVLGLALLIMPATPFALEHAGVPVLQLKYFAGLSLAVFGIVLLTVCLLRRQRALASEVDRRVEAEAQLRESNVQLETRVQERTEHLRELIGGLEAFNRGVSHDLRGPLGGMSGLARMAAESLSRGDSSLAQRALPMIERQCNASASLVNTMLDLARLGERPSRREHVCLSELVQAAFDEVLLGADIAIKPRLQCGPLPMLLADPNLLRPVFVNLIGNAVKFTRSVAAPCIQVEATVNDNAVTIGVLDNGVGFPAEVAQRMFEPFYRGHATSHAGHGLGLSIVRRAVEAMGGSVWAEGGSSTGASLYFRLPGAAVQAPTAP